MALSESSSGIPKGHPEEPFFQKFSGRTTSSGKFPEEVFRKISGRRVLPDDPWLLPEIFRNNFFRKFWKKPSRFFRKRPL